MHISIIDYKYNIYKVTVQYVYDRLSIQESAMMSSSHVCLRNVYRMYRKASSPHFVGRSFVVHIPQSAPVRFCSSILQILPNPTRSLSLSLTEARFIHYNTRLLNRVDVSISCSTQQINSSDSSTQQVNSSNESATEILTNLSQEEEKRLKVMESVLTIDAARVLMI